MRSNIIYEGRLKVILLLQVGFEPTFNILVLIGRPAQIKTDHQTFDK